MKVRKRFLFALGIALMLLGTVGKSYALEPGEVTMSNPNGSTPLESIKIPPVTGTYFYRYVTIKNNSTTDTIKAYQWYLVHGTTMAVMDCGALNAVEIAPGNNAFHFRDITGGATGPLPTSSSYSTNTCSSVSRNGGVSAYETTNSRNWIAPGQQRTFSFGLNHHGAFTVPVKLFLRVGTGTSGNIQISNSLFIEEDSTLTVAGLTCPTYWGGSSGSNNTCQPLSSCPIGHTGTAPYCSPPASDPGGGEEEPAPYSPPTEPSPRDLQLVALALSVFIAVKIIGAFRWKESSV